MSCDLARERLSAAQDGVLASDEHEALRAHLETCSDCTAHRERLERVRRAVRYEAIGEVPDVAAAVVAAAAAARQRRRWRERALVAAAFTAAVLAGGAFVGLDVDHPPSVLADVPERVVAAQAAVTSLSADLEVVERGWHAAVPERRYEGRLVYRAPESLALRLDDHTTYPDDRWVANDVRAVTDGDMWWAVGPADCPSEALPGCADPSPRTRAVTGREPFRAATPAPLDLVVPVRSFALAATPQRLGSRQLDGRRALGIATTAGQVAPLLDGLRQAGTLREVHPSDPVDLWLDDEALVPLALTVRAAVGPERARWAARHGYDDTAGAALLEIELRDVALNAGIAEEAFPAPPDSAEPRAAGFVDQSAEALDVPEPGWLPDGMAPHRAGVARGRGSAPTVAVTTWSDGRAWLKVRATRDWQGGRLFGSLGDAVRRVETPTGVAYVGQGGRAIALHGEGIDVVVTGSLPEAELLQVAGSLPMSGGPVPGWWSEAGTVSVEEVGERVVGVLVPPRLAGFAPAAARVVGDTVVIGVTGPGARGFVVTQEPGDALTPPLEPDVRGVEVRGVAGRYTPGSGELEWVEDGRVVSLRSVTLSLDELVAVAERLEAAP